MSRPFPTMYEGHCADCGKQFNAGDQIEFNDDDQRIASECCGDASEPHGRHSDTPPGVMPRGRTVDDRCLRCFQIPANNGACGCDA